MVTHHRYAEVGGRTLFYREAGPVDAPVVVLLHGYPTSSFMFRELIPLLADRYRVIAPDMLGFGLSDAPPVEEFTYTFDAVADLTGQLLDALGVRRFAIYVQDYGAPIGWRLLLGRPGAVTAVISQNGNGHEAGFVTDFWEPIWAYARETTPENEQALRPALGIEAIRWQYTHGVPDPSVVSPDTWHHDAALLARPGNDRVQLALFADYVTNVALYPALHERLCAEQIPVLAVWGRNDEIFGPAGATALGDVAGADVRLVDGGHFLLESAPAEVAGPMLEFLDRHVGRLRR
ncbi:pimeloyl-ACP methyl ester carboxylesterase [Pseudonocardia sediminis]|uniref:Pimeloyl-ACP methyl ester carboxylesterase n=1 Tax=Pseudonocardia sediminis TaxID=1397368 RepID=A0A4Q7V050_PSEST|nr:alpha/beta hydrolase [Pseudonocardia sediminis]RZT87817.1 pimeloyl-ACP methyl ester carboxylesterase [Pseudonocardia sediminis]